MTCSPAYGKSERYLLKDSPSANSVGACVQKKRRPHLWLPGQKPFYVTDESKLKVICPLKYRLYADYVHNNVPYRTEEVELLPHDPSDLDLAGIPAVEDLASGTVDFNPPTTHWDQAALDCEHLCLPCMGAELDEPVTVSDLPADMPTEEVVSDPSPALKHGSAERPFFQSRFSPSCANEPTSKTATSYRVCVRIN